MVFFHVSLYLIAGLSIHAVGRRVYKKDWPSGFFPAFILAVAWPVLLFGALVISSITKSIDRMTLPSKESGGSTPVAQGKVARIRVEIDTKRKELEALHEELEVEESKKDPYKRTL